MAVRRQAVARGGMFNTPKVSFSKETQELLKVMMEESKLTNFQQRQLKQTLSSGRSLPLQCHPTSSDYDKIKPTQSSRKKPHTPSKQGLRSKGTIDKLIENTDDSPYRPHPSGYDSSKEKKKLQNVMAFGSDLEPITPTKASHKVVDEEEEEMVDRFEEVLGEIEERKQFLDDMEALGQDKPHRARIMTEISQRIRELEEIDKKRSLELKQSLQNSARSTT